MFQPPPSIASKGCWWLPPVFAILIALVVLARFHLITIPDYDGGPSRKHLLQQGSHLSSLSQPKSPLSSSASAIERLRDNRRLKLDNEDEDLMMGIQHSDEQHMEHQEQHQPLRRFPPDLPFLDALATCDTFECVKAAHMQPRKGARFNYPHFMILGWQKSATTSLYIHFIRHKYIAKPAEKEPEFFSEVCDFDVDACDPDNVKDYLRNTLNFTGFLKSNGSMATFEASTHYARGYDRLAPGLYQIFPWVKVVLMLREPISRAMSMLVHKYDKKDSPCLARHSMAYCLLHESQISGTMVARVCINVCVRVY